MLNYDLEAETYDATRGGEPRAAAAAAAVQALLPASARLLADLACGTGIVTARLRRPDRRVIGVDRSAGMARLAAGRLTGQILVGDATRLPLAGGSLDAAVMIWLLHLLDEQACAAALAEAARVLRPGGVFLTTVDKNDADFAVVSDVGRLIEPVRRAWASAQPDSIGRLRDLAAPLRLTVTAQAAFTGKGQGRSPRQWRARLLSGNLAWTRRGDLTGLCDQLRALPDQDRSRPDPVYRLAQLTKAGPRSPAAAAATGPASAERPGSPSPPVPSACAVRRAG